MIPYTSEVEVTFRVPIVDLAATSECHLPAEQLDAVRFAAEQVGIINVINHGMPDLIADFRYRMGRVLSLPRERKEKLASPDGYPYRGWREWPDDFGRLEVERYTVGQFDSPADAATAGVPAEYCAPYANSNVWPEDDSQLRAATFRYIDACRNVAQQVLNLYARALGATPIGFSLGGTPHLRLSANNYPAWSCTDGGEEDKLLLRAHSDDSMLTVLTQEGDYDGLQVQLPDGGWHAAPAVPGAVQALSGKMLTRLTNGRLRTVLHRVVAGGTLTRRSTAVFCSPGLQTVLVPLADFRVGSGPGKFEPLLIWDDVCRTGGP